MNVCIYLVYTPFFQQYLNKSWLHLGSWNPCVGGVDTAESDPARSVQISGNGGSLSFLHFFGLDKGSRKYRDVAYF